jgi:tetratricopeptide (TPR) repeat protein
MSIRLLFIAIVLCTNTILIAQPSKTDSINAIKNSSADSSLTVANKYLVASEVPKAFLELKKAQALFQKTGSKKGQLEVSIAFAKYYENNLLWPDAERYYRKALSLTDTDSTATSAEVAFNLAQILYRQQKYQEALEYDQTALDYFSDKGLKGKMAECYVHIARIKIEQKNYSQAESLILKYALPLFRSASNDFGRISCFDVLGKTYYSQKKYSPAKWFFIQANTQSRNLKDTIGIISSLVELGKVKIAIKDYDLAIRDFKEAESLSHRKHALSLLAEVEKAYGMLYKQTGNKKAYSNYTDSYDELSDSLSDIHTRKATASRKAESDADAILSSPPSQKEQTTKSAANFYAYLTGGFAVLLVIIFICVYRIRKEKFKRS